MLSICHVEELIEHVVMPPHRDRRMWPAELRLGLKQRDKVVLDHAWRDLVQGVLTELFKEPLSEAFIELRRDGCFVFAGIIQIDFLEKPCKVLQVGILEDRPRPNLSFQVIFFLPCLSFGSLFVGGVTAPVGFPANAASSVFGNSTEAVDSDWLSLWEVANRVLAGMEIID